MLYFLSSCDCADDKQPIIREAVGKFIVENLQEDESSGIAEMCRHIILEEFKANIAIAVTSNTETNPADEEHSYFALLWPFTLIERCDGTTMEGTVKILCEEMKLAHNNATAKALYCKQVQKNHAANSAGMSGRSCKREDNC
ncbi:hypothetical protein SUGI_1337080 [Cryptomeria japonica]|uniref:Uncharacterized protein n=1 Tax=Cryptomeria japonica TaxID=3369 RepID=A0AAD3NTN6_CRYJA|nr:hypothetical protein SUGI_1337080 [Cryptomeria japonica]